MKLISHVYLYCFVWAFLWLSVFLPNTGFAQENQSGVEVNWRVLQVKNGVEVSEKTVHCDFPENGIAHRYKLIKVKNINDSSAEVGLKFNVHYNGICYNCNSDEDLMKITLEAQGETVGACQQKSPLRIIDKMIQPNTGKTLTQMEIAIFEVEK